MSGGTRPWPRLPTGEIPSGLQQLRQMMVERSTVAGEVTRLDAQIAVLAARLYHAGVSTTDLAAASAMTAAQIDAHLRTLVRTGRLSMGDARIHRYGPG